MPSTPPRRARSPSPTSPLAVEAEITRLKLRLGIGGSDLVRDAQAPSHAEATRLIADAAAHRAELVGAVTAASEVSLDSMEHHELQAEVGSEAPIGPVGMPGDARAWVLPGTSHSRAARSLKYKA